LYEDKRLLLVAALPLGERRSRARVAVGIKAGTLGAGLEADVGRRSRYQRPRGRQGFQISRTPRGARVKYDATAELRSAVVLIDFHPKARGFRFSIGAAYDRNEVRAVSAGETPITINGVTYPVQADGLLRGESDRQPDLSVRRTRLGGNAVARKVRALRDRRRRPLPRQTVRGPAHHALRPPHPARSSTRTSRRSARKIEDDVSRYRVFPVVSVGVSFRF